MRVADAAPPPRSRAGRRPERLAALALLALLTGAAAAAAHEEVAPKQDLLELHPRGLRLVLDYAVPAGEEARALRRLFDGDRSGALDAGEEGRLAAHLGRLAAHFLSLSLDGVPLPLREEAAERALSGGEGDRLAVRLTLGAAVDLSGSHRLRVADRHKDRRVLVPLRLRLRGLTAAAPRLPPLPLLRAEEPLELELRPAAPAPGP